LCWGKPYKKYPLPIIFAPNLTIYYENGIILPSLRSPYMKITKSKLKQLIKEELQSIMEARGGYRSGGTLEPRGADPRYAPQKDYSAPSGRSSTADSMQVMQDKMKELGYDKSDKEKEKLLRLKDEFKYDRDKRGAFRDAIAKIEWAYLSAFGNRSNSINRMLSGITPFGGSISTNDLIDLEASVAGVVDVYKGLDHLRDDPEKLAASAERIQTPLQTIKDILEL